MTHYIPKPQNQTVQVNVKGGTMVGRLVWNTSFQPTTRFNLAQKYVDSEVLRLSNPMTPMRTGALKGSGSRATKIGSGEVKYNTPYARYQYYGKVMVGSAPRKLTNKALTYSGAPTRGAKWFERMKISSRSAILKGALKILNGH